MKNNLTWIIIGAIGLFILGLWAGMILPFGWNNSAIGYACANGFGMQPYRGFMPMMGGWGRLPFGFFGMLLMWLFPLGILALIIGGAVWLIRALAKRTT